MHDLCESCIVLFERKERRIIVNFSKCASTTAHVLNFHDITAAIK